MLQSAAKLNPAESKVLYKCVSYACEAVTNCENMLNIMDTSSGDGDCGATLKRGMSAVWASLGPAEQPSALLSCPHQLALSMASIVEDAMGGSSGALYSLFLS